MTELIWDGKYKDGKRVAPLRVSLPFQTIETVNESAQQRQTAMDLFSAGRNSEWRNRLIWGDKKYVLPSLLPEFAGKVNLVCIDPPFNVGADFSFTATIPEDPNGDEDDTTSFTKQPSMIEQKAYRDTWGRGLDSYLQWFYETVVLLRELLAEDGSMYVHLDYHIGHYAKVVMDEVFGQDNLKNEIIWKRSLPHNDPKKFGSIHDILLFYVKSENYVFNQQFTGLSEEYVASHYNQVDEKGRKYQLTSLAASGSGPARTFGDKVLNPPKGNHWRYSQKNIDELMTQGRIVFTSTNMPRYIRYMDEMSGPALQSIWTDVYPVNSQATERLDYATQKPEALLKRMMTASSDENQLVLDCFGGSGTVAAVAEKNNRRWIVCDLGRFAIHTTRKRLLSIENVRPFVVQNLGKYERQLWQSAEFGEQAAARNNAYRQFILELYHAQPISGYSWLHGLKAGRMVHVGAVDSPVSPADVTQIAIEFKKAMGTGQNAPKTNGVDVLGWDFAFEMNEIAQQQAAQANLNVRFLKIPREVLEKKAVDQGDIKFFELAALSVKTKVSKRTLSLTLNDFIIPPDDVPEDVRHAISHWSQWIDYWAVDWDFRGDTFHNQWQSYRTRTEKQLQLQVAHDYEEPGEYQVVVKVIDILGNDSTKTITVNVR
jgi:adenine-specific DNA-methyltransferase